MGNSEAGSSDGSGQPPSASEISEAKAAIADAGARAGDDQTAEVTAGTIPLVGRPGAILPRGTTVGRYVALDVLGKGGMGVVYRAWDPTLSRPIALKLVDAPAGTASALRERLLREAQALAQLSHPNVVAVHDVGASDTGVFIAMELIKGETFAEWLGARARSEREICHVLLQAGDGLAAAHAAGMVHRDFKPANVMVGADGRTRVLDFGVARAVEPSGHAAGGPAPAAATVRTPVAAADAKSASGQAGLSTESEVRLDTPLTRHGAIVGTPRFMAPEQHSGGVATQAADQFSFCVVAWEALFGKYPFTLANLSALRRAQ